MHFVCWLWRGRGFEQPVATYGVEHVAILANMLRRHGDHILTCVHDGVALPSGIGGIRMPPQVANLPDYLPKLWAFSPEFHELMLGARFVSIDLDVVVLGDLEPVLAARVPLLIWDSARGEPYNTSLFALEPGFHTEVWRSLTPADLERAKSAAARWTGDQSWLAHVLGPGVPTFGEDTGVIRYRPSKHRDALPEGTRAAFLCGPMDPATERERCGWIRRNWR